MDFEIFNIINTARPGKGTVLYPGYNIMVNYMFFLGFPDFSIASKLKFFESFH